MEYMGLYVFPKMKSLFRAENAKLYASFRCQTCHGSDMEAVSYKMPNRLNSLPLEGAEQAAMSYDEATAKFMIDKVVPTMRELIGRNDPTVANAVSCRTCHPKE